ncbi:MAG: FtsQ-type POTRA domain-containing protein [Candidatus Marinimicrobia bacterium]|jgi:cell division protein FtsQ|nr:FtsQ-type POTRA domain-containing protein [Candidatus Neomarinimicrobiota bacterium]
MRKYFKIILKVLTATSTLAAFVALIWGSFSWAEYTQLFKNPNIVFTGNSIVEESEYRSFLLKEVGSDIFTEDISAISSRIEQHPYVAGARVSKHFPKGILIDVSERYPVALINNNPLLLIDNNSYVMPFRNNYFDFQIPILSNFKITDKLYPVGKQTLSPIAINMVQFLKRIKKEYPQLYQNLSEVRLTKYNDYELILAEEPTKIVIGKSITWSKILVLKEFEKNISGRKSLTDYAYLDLRYDNQVITKERQT